MKKISRRSFLAVCGAMAATAALTACGGSSASTAGTAASGSTAGSTAGSAASGEVFELKLSTTQTDTSMTIRACRLLPTRSLRTPTAM